MTPVSLAAPPSDKRPPRKGELTEIPEGDDLPPISESEAIEATKEAGMHLVNLSRVKHYTKIGRYLAKAGLVPLHRAKLMGRMEALEVAREKLQKMMDKEYFDDERDPEKAEPVAISTGKMLLGLAQAIGTIANVENQTAELDVKLDKLSRDDAPKAAHTNQAPPPGATVQLIGTVELKAAREKAIVAAEVGG